MRHCVIRDKDKTRGIHKKLGGNTVAKVITTILTLLCNTQAQQKEQTALVGLN